MICLRSTSAGKMLGHWTRHHFLSRDDVYALLAVSSPTFFCWSVDVYCMTFIYIAKPSTAFVHCVGSA
ncbi:hypothetical protein F7725_017116 [Dissostichus mawsoni]|uniref:Uncharacterized protein n=1 Tax=Dissostichus mawsoni TaxID=36200 RepID=A0A7J5Z4H0_DISMA|nr:hypothetical protein F7725_017116 [Dissostichus mawsoni]